MALNTGLFNLGTQSNVFGGASNPFGTQYNHNDAWANAAYQTALGNQAGAQYATQANRVNQVTPFGNVSYTQSGTDAQGNPIWTATQTLNPQLQQAYGSISNQVANQYGQAFNPQLPSVGINPGETYSDAIMRRLQPQMQMQQEKQQSDLANQGIVPYAGCGRER